MKDPSDNIRTWLYEVLYGTVAYNNAYVPVYSFAPKDAVMPHIVIGEQTMDAEDGTKDAYITTNNTVIEIYASYTGNDAKYKAVNSIAEDILEIVRQRTRETHGSGGATVTAITGFNIITTTLAGALTDRIVLENMIVVFKQIEISMVVEEIDTADIPAAPTATAATSVIATSFSANWGAVSQTISYYLDVSTSATFATFVTGFQNKAVGNVLTYSITGLTELTTYYYRVRAYNSNGTSASSNTITTIPGSVVIGTQTWAKYNYSVGGWYVNDDPNTQPDYGLLFDWTEALAISVSGWHLPTKTELETLRTFVGGNTSAAHLMESGLTHWNVGAIGDDTSGFSARGAGAVDYLGNYLGLKESASFWSATQVDASLAYGMVLVHDATSIIIQDDANKMSKYSVRLIKT
jgi:uncharacterized protein (TIGR02145 family)